MTNFAKHLFRQLPGMRAETKASDFIAFGGLLWLPLFPEQS